MKTYLFTVSLEPDEEGWRAFYAPLEHLGASTWGATEPEALEHIQEVLSLIVEDLRQEGKEIPVLEGLMAVDQPAVLVPA